MITEQDLTNWIKNPGHWINLYFLSANVVSVTREVVFSDGVKQVELFPSRYTDDATVNYSTGNRYEVVAA